VRGGLTYHLKLIFLIAFLLTICLGRLVAQSTYTTNGGFSGDDDLMSETNNSNTGRWAKRVITYDNFEFYCSQWKGSTTVGTVGCIIFRWGNGGYFCLTQERDTGKFRLKQKNTHSGNDTRQLAYYDGPDNAQPSVKIICVGQNIIVEIDGVERMNVTHAYEYSGDFAFWKSGRYNDGNKWYNITYEEVPLGSWTGAVSTDFHDPNNWSGSILPNASDDIIIPDVTNQPVVTQATSVNSVFVHSGADITISSESLSIADSTNMNGTLIIESGAVFDANGDFDATGGNITFNGGGTLQVSNTTINSFGTLSNDTGTIEFDGASQTIPAGTYHNLKISQSGTKSLSGDITVNGDIILSDGELDVNGNKDVELIGDMTKTSGALVNSSSSNGYLILNATSSENASQTICGFSAPSISIKKINSANIEITGDISANYLWLQSSNVGTFTIDNNYNVDVDDKIVIAGGTLNVISGSLSTSKNSSSAHQLSGGTLDIDGGTVSFGSPSNSTADLNIDGGTVDISGGTLNVSDCFDIASGTFTQSGGTVNVKTNTSADGDGDHKFAIDAGTLHLTGGTMNLLGEDDDVNHYSMSIASGVTTTSTSAHTIAIFTNDASDDEDRFMDLGDASNAIGNLTFDLSGHELYFKSNANILGNLTANNGDVDVSSHTVNVAGNADFTADDLLISSGTLDVDGTFNAPNNITFSDAGRLQLSGTVSSLGTLTNSVGTVEYDANGAQDVLADTYFNLEIDGSGTKTLPTSNITVNGDLMISAGTLEYNGGSSSKLITLKGSMSGSGVITANTTSTFLIDGNGTNQDICCISSDDIGIRLDDVANATTTGDISCKYLDLLVGSTGSFTIDGEIFTINPTNGYLEMNGADLTVSAGSLVNNSTSGTLNELDAGTLTVSGGTVQFTGNNSSSTGGDLNIDGGTLTVTAGSISINDELDVGSGTINQSGGAIYIDAGSDSNNGSSAHKFDMDAGSLNLSGGTLYLQSQSHSSYKCIDIDTDVNTLITSAHSIDIGTNSTPKDMYIALNGHAIGNLTVNLSGKSAFLTGDLNIQGAVRIDDGVLVVDSYTATVSGSTTVSGNLQIGSGQYDANGDFDASIGTIDFSHGEGKLLISSPSVVSFGALDDQLGTVIFDGSSIQTIEETETFYDLKIDNTAGIMLNEPVNVNNILHMNVGNIFNPNDILTVGSSAGEGSINYNSGIITGMLRQYFPNAVGSKFYPIGNSEILRDVTIELSSPPGINQYLIAAYKPGNPQGSNGGDLYEGLPLMTDDGQIIETYDDEGYWEIIPGSASLGDSYLADINGHPYNVSIHCNNLTADDGVSPINMNTVRVIKSSGPSHASWEGMTHVSVSGTDADFITTASGIGFSFFGAGKGNEFIPLPVELVSFTGECTDGVVYLEWQTASENNSEDFELEYSRDGLDWSLIQNEQAAGFSNELITYNYEHSQAILGDNYYRLTQNDIDGTSMVYENLIINASCKSASKEYFSVFPNPGSGNFNVVINNPNIEGWASLNITDMKGGLVYNKPIAINSGINMFVVNQNLSPGIYFINIKNESTTTRVLKYLVK